MSAWSYGDRTEGPVVVSGRVAWHPREPPDPHDDVDALGAVWFQLETNDLDPTAGP